MSYWSAILFCRIVCITCLRLILEALEYASFFCDPDRLRDISDVKKEQN